MEGLSTRRAIVAAGGLGAAALLAAPALSAETKEVSAVEDLMREHGVLRRILVVYRETGAALRNGAAASLDAGALGAAAALFKTFGEDYHERKLEEQHIFPTVERFGGAAARLVPTLLAQHDRGREINAFITGACAHGRVRTGDETHLADALSAFARMYEAHTAFEDTVVFQAWRNGLSAKSLDRAGDLFEDIERDTFKGDGFDKAVEQIAAIEQRLGLTDIARYTAPPT